MNPDQSHRAVLLAFGLYALLGLATTIFFAWSRDAKLKRKVFIPLSALAGISFFVLVIYLGAPTQALLFVAPFAALIIAANIRAMRFCDACGRTMRSRNLLAPLKFCSACGAPLSK